MDLSYNIGWHAFNHAWYKLLADPVGILNKV